MIHSQISREAYNYLKNTHQSFLQRSMLINVLGSLLTAGIVVLEGE